MIKVIAFDCFGTVFDMSSISHEEISAYVRHVRSNNFSPYSFPDNWENIKAHTDSAKGIKWLQELGYKCVALSNGSKELIEHISEKSNIKFDHIVDLVKHRVYKPNIEAYRTIEKDLGIIPEQTLMVTANGNFGDIEGASSIGMKTVVIRKQGIIDNIICLYNYISNFPQ